MCRFLIGWRKTFLWCFDFFQLHWLGDKYFLRGSEGNDIHKTNVPSLRISFRHEVENFKNKKHFIRPVCLLLFHDCHSYILTWLRLLMLMQTWKDEMQYIYAGQATFPEDVDPWSQPNEIPPWPRNQWWC